MDAFEINEKDMEWTPADFPRGHLKLLHMDPRTGGQIMLLHLEPHCEMPAHNHISDEASYVLAGSVVKATAGSSGEILTAGHFAYFPGGSEHGPFRTEEEECYIFNIFYGPLK
jgi:quercetin dioxygenase-like cupin family protein